MTTFDSYFGAYWSGRPLTLAQFGGALAGFLVGLKDIDPIFRHWYWLGSRMNEGRPLGDRLENLHDLLMERAWDRKAPKEWFTNLDAGGNPSAESMSQVRWRASLATAREDGSRSSSSQLLISAGGSNSRLSNSVTISVNDPDSPLLDPGVSEKLIRYMVDFWDADEAVATEHDFTEAVSADPAFATLGRFNYQSDSSIALRLPALVHSERFHGGVLFRIGDGRPLGPDNTTEIEIGRNVAQVIAGSRGLG